MPFANTPDRFGPANTRLHQPPAVRAQVLLNSPIYRLSYARCRRLRPVTQTLSEDAGVSAALHRAALARSRGSVPNHDIIVVGASAGGVEALKALVQEFPANLPAAVFVVLHIPAQSPS